MNKYLIIIIVSICASSTYSRNNNDLYTQIEVGSGFEFISINNYPIVSAGLIIGKPLADLFHMGVGFNLDYYDADFKLIPIYLFSKVILPVYSLDNDSYNPYIFSKLGYSIPIPNGAESSIGVAPGDEKADSPSSGVLLSAGLGHTYYLSSRVSGLIEVGYKFQHTSGSKRKVVYGGYSYNSDEPIGLHMVQVSIGFIF